jgi:monovalent cation/hydrogen antiporter
MNSLLTLILLMSIAIVLVGLAMRWQIPYPLALVVGGVVLGFIPKLKTFDLDPHLVQVIVLPPILYYAAYSVPFKEFRGNIQHILWLALGLVIVTTVTIGWCFKWLFPDLPWALAFTFGAIISPPDAVAATTILKNFTINTKLLTVLEGESLINDATGLLLYRLALVALLSGSFDAGDASIDFLQIVGGGLLIGVITGYGLHIFSSHFFDPILSVIYSFVIPYIVFILADSLELSGVLAVVVSGLIGSRLLTTHFSPLTRVIGWASWDIFIIVLNCFVFILIGLQLYGIVQRLTLETAILYLWYGFVLTLAMIIIRFIWVYIREGMAYLTTKQNSRSLQETLHEAIILSWSGMRGIVSLTLALALPFNLPDGSPLLGRDIVVFLTFVIILFTLLIPGLSLSWLMQRLNIPYIYRHQDIRIARKRLLKAAREAIQRLYDLHHLDDQEATLLLTYFNTRHQILEIVSKAKRDFHSLESARKEVLYKKRECLLEMRTKNEIDDQLFRWLERELDLEEAYLVRDEI